MKITKKDRIKYPYHTDASILGIKLMKRLDSKFLMNALQSDNGFDKLRKKFSADTNLSWIKARTAATLYNRKVLSDWEFQEMCNKID